VVNRVVPELIRRGSVPRPGIGIAVMDEESTARMGVSGIIIANVSPGSPAAAAGLVGIDRAARRLGDIIVAVGGKPVTSTAELAAALEDAGIGATITLTVVRGQAAREVDVEVIDIS
jgi:2-alkenal reductase